MPSPIFRSPVGTPSPRTRALLAAASVVEPGEHRTYQGTPCGLKGCTATTRVFLRPIVGDPQRIGWWDVRCASCWAPFFWRPETSIPSKES